MKIGILTIATGRYSMYIPELIESCEELFLENHDKEYFVYTDSDIESLGHFKGSEKITKIHQEKLGWPYDSMMRFHMFDAFKDILSGTDYLFFMNANMKVVSRIDESILPSENKCGIVATRHPGFHRRNPGINYPHESNPQSSFFVNLKDRSNYFQGCFNGGRSKEFLKMCEILKNNMDTDLKNNIVPIWHDESAINWYLEKKDPLVLYPTYAYPEYCDGNIIKKALLEKNNDEDIPSLYPDFSEAANPVDPFKHLIDEFSEPRIIQRNKNKDGGKIYLRK